MSRPSQTLTLKFGTHQKVCQIEHYEIQSLNISKAANLSTRYTTQTLNNNKNGTFKKNESEKYNLKYNCS